ncbi:MAG TPA: carboxymuconolactone decarboxylase family protein [Bryobacteraceae bacterium]|jgi:alkylhydroperoxidase family enzyme|nr:carboxymuconolactone decarboxylase family protein [Bryobacteraceae bacterium]
MTAPRIAPLDPPYDPAIAEALAKWMPPGSKVEPLKLFRTLVRSPEISARLRALGAGILGPRSLIAPRDREILIHRTTALCGCEYEWGVHAAVFGEAVGLTPEALRATAARAPDDPVWSKRDALLVRLAEELHGTAHVSDRLWTALSAHWEAPQLIELLIVAGAYRLIAYVANGAQVALEEWAARFPEAGAARKA